MSQKLIQTQEQKLQQVQRLTAQQLLQVKLLEMPINELEQNINAELDDNPALERSSDEDTDTRNEDVETGEEDTSYEEESEREEREDELDNALENLGKDDEMPEYESSSYNNNADYEEMVFGDTTSFYDMLKDQMSMMELDDKQREVIEYLIGSLDDDGLLRKDLDTISDELAIYHNIDLSKEDIERALKTLQSFDPAGVGGRNLQECLLLQIHRREKGKLRDAMERVIHEFFDEFTKKHWKTIQAEMVLSDLQTQTLQEEIKKLNPKPGSSLGESEGITQQQITPDFIVDTNDDGTITFTLNLGNVPELIVSPTFNDMVDTYQKNKEAMNRQDKEALLYAKEKVEKAKGYINAIKQRQHTLIITMKAIIKIQRKFFLDGDETDLKPMNLKDIADITGLDISTISRVSNIKYAQTKWGIFPLRFFFSDSYTTKDGEEMSTRKIKIILKEIVDKENKEKPFSDEALTLEMKKAGYPIARRTVAKYREQLNIPAARLRKI